MFGRNRRRSVVDTFDADPDEMLKYRRVALQMSIPKIKRPSLGRKTEPRTENTGPGAHLVATQVVCLEVVLRQSHHSSDRTDRNALSLCTHLFSLCASPNLFRRR